MIDEKSGWLWSFASKRPSKKKEQSCSSYKHVVPNENNMIFGALERFMNTATEPRKKGSHSSATTMSRARNPLQDWRSVSRWIGQNIYPKPFLGAFVLCRLKLPSLKLIVPLGLLLTLTAGGAWLGSTQQLPSMEVEKVSFFQRMPNGDLAWIHRYRGRVLDSDHLPKSGNSAGDEFATYDGRHWIYLSDADGTVPVSTWVDP
jgi:hypothetical protein